MCLGTGGDSILADEQQSGRSKRDLNLLKTTLNQVWPRERGPRAAMCVQTVDAHVSCSSHDDAQLAAFFIDPRAEGSTEMVCISLLTRTGVRPSP